jgi:hypothetical protein
MAERFLPESKVVKDALARIADDPRARFAFFRRLLAVAQEAATLCGLPSCGLATPRPLDR